MSITITLLCGILAGLFLATLVAELACDIDVASGNNLELSSAGSAIFTQGIMSLIAFILFPIIHITILQRKSLRDLVGNVAHIKLVLLLVLLLGLACPFAISPLAEWNANLHLPKSLAKTVDTIPSFDSINELLFALMVMSVIAGIGEELVFRGMIQNELWRSTKNIHLSIWASSFIFSVVHMQLPGFIPRLLLGALLGYLYYWSGNLVVPIFAHFVNNAFSLVMSHLYSINAISPGIGKVESVSLSLVSISIIVSVLLIYNIRKLYLGSPDS